jgi:hypothetical protein
MNRRQFTCYALCAFGAQCLSLSLYAGQRQICADWTKLREFALSRHCSIFPLGAGECETALDVLAPLCRKIATDPNINHSQMEEHIRNSVVCDIKLRRVIAVSTIEISMTDRALQVLAAMSHEELLSLSVTRRSFA